MKTLKDILEASILDNAISEASLLDIEGTLKDGDDYVNTYKLAEQELAGIFKDLDKFKVWKKYLNTGIEFKRNNCCANLCKILGNEKANSIRIVIMELGLNSYHVYIWLHPDNVKNEYQHWQVSRAKIYAAGKNIKEALQVFILTYKHIFSDVKAFEYFVKADEHKGDKWENI